MSISFYAHLIPIHTSIYFLDFHFFREKAISVQLPCPQTYFISIPLIMLVLHYFSCVVKTSTSHKLDMLNLPYLMLKSKVLLSFPVHPAEFSDLLFQKIQCLLLFFLPRILTEQEKNRCIKTDGHHLWIRLNKYSCPDHLLK